MEPVIGITCKHEAEQGQILLEEGYVRAIEAAGGLPLLLPPLGTAALVARCATVIDGLLLAGGPDIDPVHFGEEPRGTGTISPLRDHFELSLLAAVLRLGKPVLAICRGVQVLNVAGGGDLYQDILSQCPEALKHMQQAPAWYPTHRVNLAPGSFLARLYGSPSLRVNSFHHQAIRRVAPGYQVAAQAEDGLVEAIEASGPAFVVGVQWHPERMWESDERQARLFRAFVGACGAGSCRTLPLKAEMTGR